MIRTWMRGARGESAQPPRADVELYKMPSPLPPMQPGQRRCRHCGYGVELHRAPGVEHWATPIGEDPPKGVTLGNECPARPVPGFRSFYGHEPS